MIRKNILIILIVLLFCTACTSNRSSITDNEPTKAILPANTSTLTAAPYPTQITKLPPTPTINPTRTPIPEGYYFNYTAGFSLAYPKQWFIEEEYIDMVSFWDSNSNISFYVFSEFGELITDDEIEAKFLELVGITEEDKEQIKIGNLDKFDFSSLSAKNIKIRYTQDRITTIIDNYYIQGGSRNYFVIIVGKEDALVSKQRVLNKIMDSFTVFSPKPYGFEDHEAIVQMTYFPVEKGLDPATTEVSAHSIVGLLYSGLVQYSPNMELIPDLAERWKISEDGKTYTFYL